MIDKSASRLSHIAVHLIGNKSLEIPSHFSESESELDRPTEDILWQYLWSAFRQPEWFRMQHPAGLEHHSIYRMSKALFQKDATFLEQSRAFGQLLHDASDHPQIKSGELIVLYFDNLSVLGERSEAIALFKSEQKQPFLFTEEGDEAIELFSFQGINPGKVDKAALILNREAEDGFRVLSVDNLNRGEEAKFWFQNFLRLEAVSDSYRRTGDLIQYTKSFVEQDLKQEQALEREQHLQIMGNSKDYFDQEEQFDAESYGARVFEDPAVADRFRDYISERSGDRFDPEESFSIDHEAVQKKKQVFKSVIKLDKNFHIYVHGRRDWIERGTDDQGRKFYKVYYEDER